LPFLNDLGVKFGGFVTNIGGDYFTPLWIFSGFILVLLFKNSMERANKFKTNIWYLLAHIILLFTSLQSLNKVSEFLYFNF